MAELKPCPICGRRAFISHDVVDGLDFGWSVGCSVACIGDKYHGLDDQESFYKARLVMFCMNSKQDAIETWNKRCEDD